MLRRADHHFIQATFVGLLILYLLAGITSVPFHGDESTIIHKSRDWFLLAQGKLAALLYSATPAEPAEQELRLVNGVVSEYSTGLLASLSGLGLHDLPEQWLWGADFGYNRANGHIPGLPLLFVARLASALLTAISIALVFAIARWLGGAGSGYLAATLYTLMPEVLLNGRRAVFEGATLIAVPIVIAAGLAVAARVRSTSTGNHWRSWLMLGLAAGFGMASKHILLVTIIPIFLALNFLGRRNLARTLGYSLAATVVAVSLFVALNPTWWSAPLAMPGEVLRLREALAAGQLDGYSYDAYTNIYSRVSALWTQINAAPQYYEDRNGWPDWIGGQIAAYEASGLQGLIWSPISALGLLLLSSMGGILAWQKAEATRQRALLVFGCTLGFSLCAIYVLTPLNLQRYYLPLAGPLAVGYGLGLAALGRELWQRSGFVPRTTNVG